MDTQRAIQKFEFVTTLKALVLKNRNFVTHIHVYILNH